MSGHGAASRRRSVSVDVAGVTVGGDAPVVVQSMTNTDTADAEGTAQQVAALARAGSELVRITVDRACAEALDKYRINPGNVGFKEKKDRQFGLSVETAIRHGKPVRIGANWGSLDQELLTRLMDENARSAQPMEARAVTREAMV